MALRRYRLEKGSPTDPFSPVIEWDPRGRQGIGEILIRHFKWGKHARGGLLRSTWVEDEAGDLTLTMRCSNGKPMEGEPLFLRYLP